MIKKILIIGFAGLITSMILNFLSGFVFPGLSIEYRNEALFRSWSDPLMSVFFAYPFIFAITSFYLWKMVADKLKGDAISKANQFAILYSIVATIPGMFATFTSFPVSFVMVLSWAISGYVDAFIAGYVFVKIK